MGRKFKNGKFVDVNPTNGDQNNQSNQVQGQQQNTATDNKTYNQDWSQRKNLVTDGFNEDVNPFKVGNRYTLRDGLGENYTGIYKQSPEGYHRFYDDRDGDGMYREYPSLSRINSETEFVHDYDPAYDMQTAGVWRYPQEYKQPVISNSKVANNNPYDYSGSGIAPETIQQNNDRTGWMKSVAGSGNASQGINENTQGGMAPKLDPAMLGGQVVRPEDIQGVNHEAAPDASATAQYIQQRNYLGTGSGSYDKQGNAIDFSDFSWGSGAAEGNGSSAGSSGSKKTIDPYWNGVKWEDIELWAKDRGIEAKGDELEKMLAAAGIPFYSEDRQDLDEATRQANLRKLYGWDAFDPAENKEKWVNSPIGKIMGDLAGKVSLPKGSDVGTGAGSGNASMGINENTKGGMAPDMTGVSLGGKIGGGVTFADLMKSVGGGTEIGSQGEGTTNKTGGEGDDGTDLGTGNGTTGNGTTGISSTTGAGEVGGMVQGDNWEDQEDQSWQNYIKWANEKEQAAYKEQRKKAWWDLLSRGLIGAANIAGAANGAPAMDIKYDDKTDKALAYQRLKDDKTQMMTLVQKRLDQIAKDKEYKRKLAGDLAKINDMEKRYQMAYDTNVAKLKDIEDKKVRADKEFDLKKQHQEKMDELAAEKVRLNAELNEYRKKVYTSQAYRNNTAGNKNAGGSRTKVSASQQKAINTKLISDAAILTGENIKAGRGDKSDAATIAVRKLQEYIRKNANDPEKVKKAKDILNKYYRAMGTNITE